MNIQLLYFDRAIQMLNIEYFLKKQNNINSLYDLQDKMFFI